MMRPYGERQKFKANYQDSVPTKEYVNWWEVEIGTDINKKRARQAAKKEIKEQEREDGE